MTGRSMIAGVVLLVSIGVARAETAVDKLVARFDELTMTHLGGWKVSPGPIEGNDPAKDDYDDGGWKPLGIDESLRVDSCWMRKTVVVPQSVAGRKPHGPLTFKVTVDDYGFLFVNGKDLGRFDWSGSFTLSQDVKPGDVLHLAIHAINTGGPLRLLQADFELAEPSEAKDEIEGLGISLRVAQKLLGFDTYQTSARNRIDPGTDRSTADPAEKRRLNDLLQQLAAKVDTASLERGDLAAFRASLAALRRELPPIAKFVHSYTLHFAANAHIDAAWLWREKETVEVCRRTFGSVLKMFDARPDFTYTQSAAAYYEWMERFDPELFSGIKKRVQDGRWEVVGGMWVEPDCNLPSGESWARHLLYAKRYFRQKLGADVTIGWNPDSFGYNANIPQFYANAGIGAFVTQKIGWNEKNVFPYRVFWWQAPDGSRVLTYFPFDYVNEVDDPFQLVDWLRQHDANSGFRKMLVLFGVGDHGGGPSLAMLDRIDKLRKLDLYPTIEHGNAGSYFSWLRAQDLSKVPVWKDELYLEYHQGTYTTQAKMKSSNRRDEVLLTNAEKLSTLAGTSNAGLEDAWRNVLFEQFHDLLPGSGIRENYIDAGEHYRDAETIGNHVLDGALHAIASKADTSASKGAPVVVFNALGWERSDVVRVTLPPGMEGDVAVFDGSTELPSQVLANGRYQRDVIFRARVPALGYAVYDLRPQKAAATTSLSVTADTLENDALRVRIDAKTGWIASIVDKKSGREVLAGPGNQLQLLEDKPDAWDAWNVGLTGTEFPSTFRGAEVIERGPVRAVVRLKRDYLKPGTKKDFPTEDFPSTFFTQDIVLDAGSDRVDFTTAVDWWETKTMLKVAFPVAVKSDVATYEIPYGTIERSTGMGDAWQKAKVEVPSQRWADLSQDGFGVSLLNTSKYGYDIKGNTMRLSLLRSPEWPDPTADRGKHTIDYALLPHAGGISGAATVRRGYEMNNPLLAVVETAHRGESPRRSFVRLAPDSLVLTTLKKAEDSNAWVVQWYDPKGEDTTAAVTFDREPSRARATNFLEEDGKDLPIDGDVVRVPSRARAVTTIKVNFR
ncbi:MAG TPA: glycoside hydrolase family 38 C-terminal domain-containing protein [Candidatus Polarisedimenticolaceae bacterium]|nr:glycoside hydrolase family 38 C-terminal domain-containing protein [Candidatus Polarisedimenticolaceae bacterium]